MKCTLFCFLFMLCPFAMAEITPADGLWTTEDDPAIGSGLMLTTQNGTTLISVFTYDDTGQNVWYIGSGVVDEAGVLEVELRQTENGQNLLLENPQSASFLATEKRLRLVFTGSQLATMEIDGSEPKLIRSNHFGISASNSVPNPIGKWVIASAENNSSYVLDIEPGVTVSPGIRPPAFPVNYQSIHPQTSGWGIYCVDVSSNLSGNNYCVFSPDQASDLNDLIVFDNDLGAKQMQLTRNFSDGSASQVYQAFRLSDDRRLLPNDGHWRPADDPENGSGLVLRTQGDYTVVVVYSYDEQGKPKWQNAAGQFDENGRMVAELVSPNDGTAIESETPQSAAFEGQPQTLEIQLEGLELATFSIDGSEPKYMQNYNFGGDNNATEHFEVNGEPFQFPYPRTHGVLVNQNTAFTGSQVFSLADSRAVISPIPPTFPFLLYSATLEDSFISAIEYFTFNCETVIFEELISPDCYGQMTDLGQEKFTKVYFEDLGVNQFRMYFDADEAPDRNANFLQMFMLQ
ncbi:hypothetical protein OS175_12715 [Marinicella sp. S1101]|uniref:hypothetical protein n=1 Tax=Marinicella marina TaxID=2996016 RepID=UPI002260BF51|nr:hypothetical protein [Marinicella marina]MCX7554736.1 hypothetical protein [Marinicella marina]MDJ1141448.1 hypothetical protein [Marinicella marina]